MPFLDVKKLAKAGLGEGANALRNIYEGAPVTMSPEAREKYGSQNRLIDARKAEGDADRSQRTDENTDRTRLLDMRLKQDYNIAQKREATNEKMASSAEKRAASAEKQANAMTSRYLKQSARDDLKLSKQEAREFGDVFAITNRKLGAGMEPEEMLGVVKASIQEKHPKWNDAKIETAAMSFIETSQRMKILADDRGQKQIKNEQDHLANWAELHVDPKKTMSEDDLRKYALVYEKAFGKELPTPEEDPRGWFPKVWDSLFGRGETQPPQQAQGTQPTQEQHEMIAKLAGIRKANQ